MIKYAVYGDGNIRLLEAVTSTIQRFRFFDCDGKEAVKFKRVDNRLLASVTGTVYVYKLPRVNDFHYEYMGASRGRYNHSFKKYTEKIRTVQIENKEEDNIYNNLIVEPEDILLNMLELVEKI